MDVPVRFIDSIINNPLLMQFLVHRWFFLLEYDPRLDQLRVYDTRSRTLETLDAYLGSESRARHDLRGGSLEDARPAHR